MKAQLSPSQLNGVVCAPPSKSCMHRALICAAAADAPTKIYCDSFSKDIKATMSCLEALGARIEHGNGFVNVIPIDRKTVDESPCVLDCNESGSTLRFMLPFAAALGKSCTFIGAQRLGERPLAPLCDALTKHGVTVSYGESFLPCNIQGKLTGDAFEIPGDISSQFITGLLFALGVMGGGEIKTTTPLKSGPYIDITTDIQKRFSVSVEKTETGYIIPCGQEYISPEEISIEGDYSNAAFWMVAGAVGSEEGITVTSLREESLQGDKKIEEILSQMGADIKRNGDTVTIKKSRLKGIETDCADIPDIVPILCVAACSAEGKTVFKNIQRLRQKESDRVKTTVDMITVLGGKIQSDETSITVWKSRLTGGTVTSANDHRIAMSAAVASLMCTDDVIIDMAEAVEKSYGDFYDKFKMLGGKMI